MHESTKNNFFSNIFKRKKKEKLPFSIGNLVSNGENRMLVNTKPKKINGEFKMLVDTYNWSDKKQKGRYCKEVFCKDWYKI